MKKFKKTLVSLVMVLLLAFTIVPSTNVTVQAASVGKVTGLKAVYTKGQTRLTWKRASRARAYEIYRSTNGQKYQKVKTVRGLSWQDTKKGELWYKVRAVHGRQRRSGASCIYF